MCMQCVAQGAPFVGVAVTMLNRRNIKNWATHTWHGANRMGLTSAEAVCDGPVSGAHQGSLVQKASVGCSERRR